MAIRRDVPGGRPGARRAVIGVAAVVLALAGCSTSGGETGSPTSVPTTVREVPSATTGAPTDTTAPTTDPDSTEPPTTTADTPATTEPTSAASGPEELAVAFVWAAALGEDLSSFVRDPAVAAAAAASLESGPDAESWDVSIEPDYIDPDSQGGGPGECQLVGDVTLTCAVLVGRPPADGSEEPSFSLYAVAITNIDPNATGPEDPLPPVPYYVVGIEGLAG